MSLVLTALLFAGGIPHIVWPYRIARFGEQIDSIGSERSWATVEPADWKVTLTRVAGVLAVVLGVVVQIAG